jgi:DNA repair protein RecO (recombination protein O)
MTEATRCIFLHAIKHGDTSSVIRIYSEKYGIASYLFKGHSVVRKNRAPLIPMLQYELTARPYDGQLSVLRSLAPASGQCAISSPAKVAQASFIAELLWRTLQHEPPSPVFYGYLHHVSDRLQQDTDDPELHIAVFRQLTATLGILPESTPGTWFDMREALFTDQLPLHADHLDKEESEIFRIALRASVGNTVLGNGKTRSAAAEIWLRFLKVQIPDMAAFRSMEVLNALFSH